MEVKINIDEQIIIEEIKQYLSLNMEKIIREEVTQYLDKQGLLRLIRYECREAAKAYCWKSLNDSNKKIRLSTQYTNKRG